MNCRPFKGSSSISFVVMTLPSPEVSVCSTGTASVTVTVCFTEPTVRVKLRLANWLTCNSTFGSVAFWKPAFEMVTAYTPGCNSGTVKRPASLVCAVRVIPVAVCTTATDASGTTAPVPSLTKPDKVAVLI